MSTKIPSALDKTEIGSDELKVEEPQAAPGPAGNVFNQLKFAGDASKLLTGSGNVFNTIDIQDSPTSDAPPAAPQAAPAKNVFNQFNYDGDSNKLLTGSGNVFNTIDIQDSPTSDAPTRKNTKSSSPAKDSK